MGAIYYVPDDIYPEISQYVIKKEDVYIVIVGSIGKVGLIPPKFDGMNLTENAARLIPHVIDKNYLSLILSTPAVQNQLFDKIKQEGVPKLAIIRLRSALLPLPPLAEQRRIVARVEELLEICDGLKSSGASLTSD